MGGSGDGTATATSAALSTTMPDEPTSTGDESTSEALPPGCFWEKSAAPGPPARVDASLTFDHGRGVVVLFGGLSRVVGGQDLDDTWEFDGTKWTRSLGSGGGGEDEEDEEEGSKTPSRRRGHSAAYDPRRQELVMFGGAYDMDFKYAWGTWIRKGGAWQEFTGGTPPLRAYAGMADHPGSKKIVLFGGRAGNDNSDETWLWDGASWQKASPKTHPSRRLAHQMALDEGSGRVLLHGGCKDNVCAERLDDTWAWDGADWTRLVDGEAAGLAAGGAAYDRSEAALLRFGTDGEARWLGADWMTIEVMGDRPAATNRFSVAYNPGSAGVVMFGGASNVGIESADTWVFRCNV